MPINPEKYDFFVLLTGSEVTDQPRAPCPGLPEEWRRLGVPPLLSHRRGLCFGDSGPAGARVDALRLWRHVGESAGAVGRGAQPRGQKGLRDGLHLPPLGGEAGQNRAAVPAADLRQEERRTFECECEI